MYFASGQAPDEPRVYRPEHELPLIGTVACPRYMIENPFDFRSTEIGIDNQACLLANHIGETLIFQLVAITRRAAILPHNRIVYRFLGIQVPNDCRLALVCDADTGDVQPIDIHQCDSLGNDRSQSPKTRP